MILIWLNPLTWQFPRCIVNDNFESKYVSYPEFGSMNEKDQINKFKIVGWIRFGGPINTNVVNNKMHPSKFAEQRHSISFWCTAYTVIKYKHHLIRGLQKFLLLQKIISWSVKFRITYLTSLAHRKWLASIILCR